VTRWGFAALCVMAAVAVYVLSLRTGSEPIALPSGPLARDTPHHGTVIDDPVGTRFGDGLETLELTGDKPATITSVEVVGGEPSLHYLGALIAGPDRKSGAFQRVHWPPEAPRLGTIVDAEGAILQPTDSLGGMGSYELILGYEITSDEYAARDSVRIEYTVEGKPYAVDIPAAMLNCPPSVGTSDECMERYGA
jgi:hypothetical protein